MERAGDRWKLTIERPVGGAVERLWRALTEPDELAGWLADAMIDLRQGGAVELRFGEDPESTVSGRVRELKAPSALEIDWHWPGEERSFVRYEIAETPRGCTLRLVHSELPARAAAGYAAGWHAHLDDLEAHLGGTALERPWHERMGDLVAFYAAQMAAER